MTWLDELVLPGSAQIQHIQKFITDPSSAPGQHYFDRLPDNLVISTDLGEDEGRFSATRDKKGRWAAVYSPQGLSFGVDVDYLAGFLNGGSNATLKWTQKWYSPRNGSFVSEEEGCGTDVATFVPPTSGSVDHDWVLLLEKIKLD